MSDGILIGRRGWSGRIASLQLKGFFLCLFFDLMGTRTGRIGGPILTIYTSYDVFPCKDVPFMGSVDISHLGG